MDINLLRMPTANEPNTLLNHKTKIYYVIKDNHPVKIVSKNGTQVRINYVYSDKEFDELTKEIQKYDSETKPVQRAMVNYANDSHFPDLDYKRYLKLATLLFQEALLQFMSIAQQEKQAIKVSLPIGACVDFNYISKVAEQLDNTQDETYRSALITYLTALQLIQAFGNFNNNDLFSNFSNWRLLQCNQIKHLVSCHSSYISAQQVVSNPAYRIFDFFKPDKALYLQLTLNGKLFEY